MKINAYLGFDGNCAEAFKHYEHALGGKIAFMMTFADAPASAGAQPSDRIMHARLEVGDQALMGSDHPAASLGLAKNFAVSVTVPELAEAEKIYAALSEGGSIELPLQPTFWSKGFAMFRDRFGIPWMINCE